MTTWALKVPICLQLVCKTSINPVGKTNNGSNIFQNDFSLYDNNVQYINTNTDGGQDHQYSCIDIRLGDWIAGDYGGFAWKIIGIVNDPNNPVYNINLTVEDESNYNFYLDQYNSGAGPNKNGNYVLFRLSNTGMPENIGTLNTIFQNISIDLIGRFSNRNLSNQYVDVYQPNQQNNFSIGQPIYVSGIDASNNCIYSASNNSNISLSIGVISSIGITTSTDGITQNLNNFSYKPYGNFYRNINDFFYYLNSSTNTYYELGTDFSNNYLPGTYLYYSQDGLNNYTAVKPIQNPTLAWVYLGIDQYVKTPMGIFYSGTSGGGGSGGGGTNYNKPPQVVFGTPYKTSLNIYIPIVYPEQTYSSDFPQPIPTIESSRFDIQYYNIGVSTTNTIMLDTSSTPFNTNYVNGLSSYSNPPPNYHLNHPLLGIIINNTTSTLPNPNPSNPNNNIFYYYDINNEVQSKQVWSIIYYVNNMNTTNTNNNQIIGYYYNYLGVSNPTYLNIGGFSQATPPSSDVSLAYNSNTNSSITLSIYKPTSTSTPYTPGLTISNYTLTYQTTGSTITYNTLTPQTLTNATVSYNNNPTVTTVASLYPDCSYSFNVKSTNSLNATSNYTYTSQNNPIYSTSYLPPLIDQSSENISKLKTLIKNSFLSGNVYSVSDSTALTKITNVINTGIVVTSTFDSYSIQYDYNSRGKNGSPNKTLMSIEAILTGGSGSNYNILQNFSGFPLITTTPNSNGSTLSINYGATTDQYSTSEYKGFYSKTNNVFVSLNLTSSSNNIYTMTVNQKYYLSDGTTLIATYTKSSNFYYDNYSLQPSVSSVSISFDPSTPTYNVSGISIVYSNPKIITNTTVNSIGDYFYVSPLLSYNFTGGCSDNTNTETNLTNISSGISQDGTSFQNIVTFSTTLTPVISTTYNSYVSLTTTVYNLVPLNSNKTTQPLKAIFDIPSYNLLTNTTYNPTSIQEISSLLSAYSGYRIWSAPAGLVTNTTEATYTRPFYGLQVGNTSYSYSSIKYNHSWDITSQTTSITTPVSTTIDTSQEIQVCNGLYQTRGSIAILNGYLDYSTYYNNTKIYSTVSTSPTNYRFSTFIWKFSGSGQIINYMNFTIYNMSCRGVPVVLSFNPNTGCSYFSNNGNTQRFFLDYRTEEIINNVPTVVPSGLVNTSNTTIWVDGNSKNGTYNNTATYSTDNSIQPFSTSGNYNSSPNDNSIIRNISGSSITYSNNNLIAKLSSIITDTRSNYYIYFRIGLPMTDNYSFQYVSLSLTSN